MRPTLNILTPRQIVRIIAEAKHILAEIGIEIDSAILKERLLTHGLTVDPGSDRLQFPSEIVDKALAAAPGQFTLFNRDGEAHATLGGGSVHFVPGSSALKLLDHRTGSVRPAATIDFVEYVRVADTLEHIAYLATAFSANDIEPQVSDAWRLYLCLTNSLQPVVSGAFTAHGVPRMAEMMALFRRDKTDLARRPLAIFTITPSGSFRYGEDSCQNLLDCLDWGIPIEIVPVTNMGLTAPVTLLEATVFHTADVLAGVVMAQLLRPGHPTLFGGAPAVFHMREATSPMAAIEAMHLTTAYVAVARYLGLPTQAYLALSDGKLLDAQAGAESSAGAMLAVLSGIDSVSGSGMLDYVMTFSLAKLVFDNEICGQALHFARDAAWTGEVSSLDLARELLAEGHLLTSEHTRRYWPDQLYLPGPLFDRTDRERWHASGSPSLWQRVVIEVEERLARYQPISTDPHLDSELRRLIRTGMSEGARLPETPESS
ncbi:MAG TPA: hypothetical protein G4N94_07705 [Caldilineae bacterium]|nr:hypothetical protein [Caldilineae bacterium]